MKFEDDKSENGNKIKDIKFNDVMNNDVNKLCNVINDLINPE